MALTPKQKLFINEYLIDFNATQAAIRAGYSEKTAEVIGFENLRKPKITEEIEKRIKDREKRTEITQDRVLNEIAKLAFFDPRKLFHSDGRPKEITELDDETAACIAGLDVLEQYEGSGDNRVFIGYVKKYKLADKKGSLELLGRHLGMWRDKMDVDVKVTNKEDVVKGLEELFKCTPKNNGQT